MKVRATLFLVFTSMAIGYVIGAGLTESPRSDLEAEQCATNCYPHVSAVTSEGCYCAVEDGYIPVGTFQNTKLSAWTP